MAAILLNCPVCGKMNRVDPERLERGSQAKCGQCKSALPIDAPLVLTDQNFAEVIRQSSIPVLVDFWAEWCGPCHALAPTVKQLAVELAGKVQVAKLNVDENPATASRFHISGIPALLVFMDGQEIDRMVGVQPKQQILARLQRII